MKIIETKNPNAVQIGKFPMTNNDDDLKVPEPLPRGAFLTLFVGTPGSGKSNLLYSLISTKKGPYYKKFDYVVIFSASFHTVDKKMGLPANQMVPQFDVFKLMEHLDIVNEQNLRALFVFDDVIASIKKGMTEFQRLIWNRRHQGKGISVFLVAQRLNAIPLEIRSAATNLIVFETQNQLELETLRREHSGLPHRDFKELTKAIWQKRYDFMFFDLAAPGGGRIFRNLDTEITVISDKLDKSVDHVPTSKKRTIGQTTFEEAFQDLKRSGEDKRIANSIARKKWGL